MVFLTFFLEKSEKNMVDMEVFSPLRSRPVRYNGVVYGSAERSGAMSAVDARAAGTVAAGGVEFRERHRSVIGHGDRPQKPHGRRREDVPRIGRSGRQRAVGQYK